MSVETRNYTRDQKTAYGLHQRPDIRQDALDVLTGNREIEGFNTRGWTICWKLESPESYTRYFHTAQEAFEHVKNSSYKVSREATFRNDRFKEVWK